MRVDPHSGAAECTGQIGTREAMLTLREFSSLLLQDAAAIVAPTDTAKPSRGFAEKVVQAMHERRPTEERQPQLGEA